MSTQDVYKQMVKTIVKEKQKSFGMLALDTANGITGITVTDDGTISLSGDGLKAVETLLQKFEEIAGKTSTIVARIHLRKILSDNPDVPVPEILKS